MLLTIFADSANKKRSLIRRAVGDRLKELKSAGDTLGYEGDAMSHMPPPPRQRIVKAVDLR